MKSINNIIYKIKYDKLINKLLNIKSLTYILKGIKFNFKIYIRDTRFESYLLYIGKKNNDLYFINCFITEDKIRLLKELCVFKKYTNKNNKIICTNFDLYIIESNKLEKSIHNFDSITVKLLQGLDIYGIDY